MIEIIADSDVYFRVTENRIRRNVFAFQAEIWSARPSEAPNLVGRLLSRQCGVWPNCNADSEETSLWYNDAIVASIEVSKNFCKGWISELRSFEVSGTNPMYYNADNESFITVAETTGIFLRREDAIAEISNSKTNESILRFRMFPYQTPEAWWNKLLKKETSHHYVSLLDGTNRNSFSLLETRQKWLTLFAAMRFCVHRALSLYNAL